MSSSNEEFAVSDKDASQSQLTSLTLEDAREDGDDKLKPLDAIDKMSESQTEINKDPASQDSQAQSAGGSSGGLPGPQEATPAHDEPEGVDDQQKARPVLSDTEKCKLIQQQLKLYLHAQNCQRRENEANDEQWQCNLLHCKIIKNMLYHMASCQAGKNCPVPHCNSAREIIGHWKDCAAKDCPLCLPRKEAEKNERADNDDSAATQPDSQTSPSFADIKKAYDAIVIAVPSTSGTAADMDVTAATANILQYQDIKDIQLPSCLQPGQVSATPVQATKEWHRTVAPDVRSHLVFKLIIAIYPNPTLERLSDPRIHALIQYAKKLEADAYKAANSRTQYYHLLAEKIIKAQKEIAEKRKEFTEQQLQVGQQQVTASTSTATV